MMVATTTTTTNQASRVLICRDALVKYRTTQLGLQQSHSAALFPGC